MTKIIKSIYKAEHKLDIRADRFFSSHPLMGFLTVFIGMPVFIITAVFVCTSILAFPLTFIFGWL